MSVYVDDVLKAGIIESDGRSVRARWSHLIADTSPELRSFAEDLGLSQSWIQLPGTSGEYFKVTAGMRALALQFGALPIGPVEASYLTLAKTTGHTFSLTALRADPNNYLLELAGLTGELETDTGVLACEAPQRIRLSRAPGFRLPELCMSVAAPSRWANPHRPAARTPTANAAAVDRFRAYLASNPDLIAMAQTQLQGLSLACWCAPTLPCHADVWLAVANPQPKRKP